MAMTYKNYPDFVKRGLRAVPVGIAQPQMCLTRILELQKRRLHSPEFVPIGTVTSLCEDPIYKEQIKEKLSRANMEAFKAPFFKKEELKMYEGIWNTKLSGMLGLAMPDVASLGAWLKSHSQCKYTLHGVTSHHLDDDYLTEIFRSGKWKPFISTLKDFYVLNEMVLATKVTIRLSKAVETGVSASLDPLAGIPSPAEIGVTVSLAANDTLEIVGATVNGVVQPFPIAFRCVHIVFNNDFTQVKKLELSRRRGDQDGLHVSEFVKKDEEYHIGAFFSNTVEEDEDDEDESDEDDASGPEVVPIRFNEVPDNVDAE